MLTLNNLCTGYGRKIIGRGLCARLERGTLTAMLGDNGAGKSTLLRTLAGFIPPIKQNGASEPAVRWDGRDISAFAPAELARTLSVVLTCRPEADALTAREVVETGRIPYRSAFGVYLLRGEAAREDVRMVSRAMELTRITRFAHRPISTLSDGERQRVFIAKALAQSTPAILLDEPTAFLDFPSKVELLRLLRHLAHSEGKTILLSTHDVETALHFADNLWLLRPDGITTGTPAELAEKGEVNAFFAPHGIRFDAAAGRMVYDAAAPYASTH